MFSYFRLLTYQDIDNIVVFFVLSERYDARKGKKNAIMVIKEAEWFPKRQIKRNSGNQ